MAELWRLLRSGPSVAGYSGAAAGASGPGATEEANGELERSALAMSGLERLQGGCLGGASRWAQESGLKSGAGWCF